MSFLGSLLAILMAIVFEVGFVSQTTSASQFFSNYGPSMWIQLLVAAILLPFGVKFKSGTGKSETVYHVTIIAIILCLICVAFLPQFNPCNFCNSSLVTSWFPGIFALIALAINAAIVEDP